MLAIRGVTLIMRACTWKRDQVNFPRIRKEEMALRQKLNERDSDLRRLKLDHAEKEAQARIDCS